MVEDIAAEVPKVHSPIQDSSLVDSDVHDTDVSNCDVPDVPNCDVPDVLVPEDFSNISVPSPSKSKEKTKKKKTPPPTQPRPQQSKESLDEMIMTNAPDIASSFIIGMSDLAKKIRSTFNFFENLQRKYNDKCSFPNADERMRKNKGKAKHTEVVDLSDSPMTRSRNRTLADERPPVRKRGHLMIRKLLNSTDLTVVMRHLTFEKKKRRKRNKTLPRLR
ncbi:hypothetical protein ZOSMA_101G00400 [Zostera marina]|uniref:Uncharacterized protein n=1 Tax=Zostera marina TaxID=29655 RepID=A0A0K9Q5A8_ZOSMR|nr:hypothetical protein ZOSMA_101G00400 [Zostera marina]